MPRNLVLKRQRRYSKCPERDNGGNTTQIKTAPSLLVLMGSLDWITTIVGIVGFGAVEGNPFLAGLVGTNLLAFTAIKLGTAIFAGLLFYQAERILNSVADKGSKAFRAVRLVLKGAYVGSVLFLVFAVMNNVWAAYAATIA